MTEKIVTQCSVEGCSNENVLARGWCSKHYQRWKKHGNPVTTKICRGDDENFVVLFWQQARLTANTEKCWEWQKAIDKDGYGKILLHKQDVRAHRVAYKLHYGEIPLNHVICHSCDNPLCINPYHLWAGTVQDNNADKWQKGHYANTYRKPPINRIQ